MTRVVIWSEGTVVDWINDIIYVDVINPIPFCFKYVLDLDLYILKDLKKHIIWNFIIYYSFEPSFGTDSYGLDAFWFYGPSQSS